MGRRIPQRSESWLHVQRHHELGCLIKIVATIRSGARTLPVQRSFSPGMRRVLPGTSRDDNRGAYECAHARVRECVSPCNMIVAQALQAAARSSGETIWATL